MTRNPRLRKYDKIYWLHSSCSEPGINTLRAESEPSFHVQWEQSATAMVEGIYYRMYL